MADPLISDLITDIKGGELLLPEFQRGYVWKRQTVKEYVRSLYRRYPTGHFLIWKTYKPQHSRGPSLRTDKAFARLILDGQQRLTSIYTLFQGKPPAFYEGETLFFNLYFNVQTEEFEFYQAAKMADNPLWMGVTNFLMKGINRWLDELDQLPDEQQSLFKKHLARFNKLDAIRNYPYHLDEVMDKPVSEIVTIFNLVNSSGTELSSADLALARICVGWPEAREALRATQQHFEAAGFIFKLEFFTRCISALAVGNVYFEGGFDEVKSDDLQSAWNDSECILEYLVNILRNDAFIDSSETLSSPYVLIPVLVYLSRNKKVFKDDEEKRWFLYWMYLALMWGRYSGSTDTSLQADVNALAEADFRTGLLANLTQKHGRLKVQPQDLEGQGTMSRFYPLTYIVARSEGAVDWFTGVKLYNSNIGKSYGLEDHHIFPQSVLYKNGYDQADPKQKKMVNELANRAFLTKKANLRASNGYPSKYLPEVKTRYPKALMHQFVPGNAKLWEIEKYPQFLVERRKLIAAGINGFLDELLASTEKPLQADEQVRRFIASGESEKLEFKSSLRWDYVKGGKNKDLEAPIMKTIAGFMNAKGGTLLIGVSPSGEILGLQNDYVTFSTDPNRDGFEQRLTQLIGSRVGKEFTQFVSISFTAIDGQDVCWIQVESSPQPVYVQDANDYKFYVRSGNTTQLLNAKEMTEFLSMKSSSVAGVAAGS